MIERPDLQPKFARIYTNSYVILFRLYSRRCSTEIVRITIKSGGLVGLVDESLDRHSLFYAFQELFIQDITLRTMKRSKDQQNVDYKDLADIVNTQDTLMFLTGQ